MGNEIVRSLSFVVLLHAVSLIALQTASAESFTVKVHVSCPGLFKAVALSDGTSKVVFDPTFANSGNVTTLIPCPNIKVEARDADA